MSEIEKNIINYSLPGLYEFVDLNTRFLKLMEDNPEKFYDDIRVDSIYGCFPCIWNGGRMSVGEWDLNDVITAVSFLNSKGIKVRYTFTNYFINPEILKDTTGNAIINVTETYQILNNDVNVANDYMYNYIKDEHPSLNVVLSTTLMIRDVDEINTKTKDHLLVLDYTLNNKWDELKKLEHPENIEVLLNETCVEDCPLRKKHYEINSLVQLREDVERMECPHEYKFYSEVKQRKHHVSIDDIRNKYLPMGINHFKLAGRKTSIFNAMEGYLEYMVKPEYVDDVRQELLEGMFVGI